MLICNWPLHNSQFKFIFIIATNVSMYFTALKYIAILYLQLVVNREVLSKTKTEMKSKIRSEK